MTRKSVPDATESRPSARTKQGAAAKPAPKTVKALKAAAADVALAKAGAKKARDQTKGEAKAAPKAAAPAAAKRSTRAAPKAADKAPAKAVRPAPKAGKSAAAKLSSKPADKPSAPVRTSAKAAARPAAKSPARSAAGTPATAAKTAARALVKASGKAGVRAVQAQAPATESARPALVRDSFTMPEQEYGVLADVKQACLRAGFEVKKSELLRIGVALVGRLDMATLRQVLGGLPQLKTGRPPSQ